MEVIEKNDQEIAEENLECSEEEEEGNTEISMILKTPTLRNLVGSPSTF
jgi:hypothetical protein